MKRLISLRTTGTILFLTTLSGSLTYCATLLPPSLERRTLRLSKDKPSFVYQYETCVKKLLFVCVETAMTVDEYDLTDSKVREQLINMGFVARVREKQ